MENENVNTENQTTGVAEAIKVVSKMSVKALGCNARKAAAFDPQTEADKFVRLCLIYGRATGTVTGEDKNTGDVWEALAGNFEGVNLQNGEKFQSGKLFLPAGIQEFVQSPLMAAQAADKSATCDFSFEIRSIPATNKAGYSYQAIPLMKPAVNDFFADMRRQVQGRAAELRLEIPQIAPSEPAAEERQIEAPAPTAAKTEQPKQYAARKR